MQIENIFNSFQNLFFPPLCYSCGEALKSGEDKLCLHCLFNLPKTNFHLQENNSVTEKFRGRIPLSKATSFLFFSKGNQTQNLIHQFKYKGKTDIGILLGQLFAEEMVLSDWLKGIDAVLAVPIHPQKRKARGYNQSDYIAKGIRKVSTLKILPSDTITKIKHTDSQTRKGNLERLQNVEHVFQLNHPQDITGKNILIIDDVLTTGATLESCCMEVLKGNPASISIATIAIASAI